MANTFDFVRSFLALAACSGLLLVTAYILRAAFHQGWRLAVLESFVVLGVLVWFITEALSAFKAITFAGLAGSWGIATLIIVVIAVKLPNESLKDVIATEFGYLRHQAKSAHGGDFAIFAYMMSSALILGVIAIAAAPSTWDSMTYHLSRVMHWQQNQTLDFYPTAIQRQLSFNPLAEMVILNFQILAGNDRLANFVQFFAMLGCVTGVSLIAKRLGGNLGAQIFAALAVMTLPMGILQATSTQNDYVLGLWSVCFAVLVLIQAQQGPSKGLILLSGAALGLAILTKVTAVLYTASIGLWFAIEMVRRLRLSAWRPLLILLSAATIIILPHSLRNYALYGNLLGITSGPETGKLTNDVYSLPALASNILRNLGFQLASPFEELNRTIGTIIQKSHGIIGIDLNDPRTSWHREHFKMIFTTHEDSAVNPLHLIMALASVVLMIHFRETRAVIYGICLATAFLAFSLVLKWQPWQSRLLLPLFILAMPLVGVVLPNYLPGHRIYVPALILAAAAIPYLFANPTRPLIGKNSILLRDRLSQYFTNAPDHSASYNLAAKMTSDFKCDRIGLVTPIDSPEYLVWVTMRKYSPETNLEHILVKNISGRLPTDFSPCAIIVLDPVQERQKIGYQNRVYVRLIDTERLNLFMISDTSQ